MSHSHCLSNKTDYIFSTSSVSADPNKIKAIFRVQSPQTTEEVKRFLPACKYNAKLTFDSIQSYAQISLPLWYLSGKNVKFAWTPSCKIAYQELLHIMTVDTAPQPFNHRIKTTVVSDANPISIAAKVFKRRSTFCGYQSTMPAKV